MNTSIAERLKRPSNAFIIWSARRRGKLAQENPHVNCGALSKMLGIEWKGMSEWEKKPYMEEANRIREERLVDLPGYKSIWAKKREEPKKRKSSAYSQRHTSPSLTQRASVNRLLPGHSPLKILTAPLPGQRLTKMSAQVLAANAIPVNRPSPTQPASTNLLLPGHSPLSILTSLQAKAVLPSQRLTEMPAQVLAADATPVNLIPSQAFTLNASGLITPTQQVYSTGALGYVISNLQLQSAVRISNLPSQPAGHQTNCLCALCVGNKQKQWIQPSLN